MVKKDLTIHIYNDILNLVSDFTYRFLKIKRMNSEEKEVVKNLAIETLTTFLEARKVFAEKILGQIKSEEDHEKIKELISYLDQIFVDALESANKILESAIGVKSKIDTIKTADKN